MGGIEGRVSIEHDPVRHLAVRHLAEAVAAESDHNVAHAQEGALFWQVLHPREGRL